LSHWWPISHVGYILNRMASAMKLATLATLAIGTHGWKQK